MNGECIRCGVETDSRIGDTWICESCSSLHELVRH
jgi:hypothetical protein